MGEYVTACGALPTDASGYVYICMWWKRAFAHADAKRVCLSAEIEYPDIVVAVLDDVNAAEGDYFEFGDEHPYDIPAYETGVSYDPPHPGYAYVTLFFDRTPEWEYNITCHCAEYHYLCEAGEEPTPQPPAPVPGAVSAIFTAIALQFESVSSTFYSLATNTEGIWLVGGVISGAFEWLGDLFYNIGCYMDDVGWRIEAVTSPAEWVAEQIAAIIARVDHLYDDLYNVVHGIMYPEMLKLNDLWYNFGVHVRDKILSTLFDFRFGAATVQKTLVQFLTEAWEMIIQLYDNFGAYVLEAIQGWPAETWAWFRQKLKEDWGIPTSLEELTAFVVAIVNSLIGWIPGSLEELKQMLDLGTWIEDFRTNIVGFVTAAIETVVDAALTWVDDQVDAYKERVWNLAEKIMEKL